jgi:TetR/AcrR family transcriptional regulator, transcriptional repressor for nem operon
MPGDKFLNEQFESLDGEPLARHVERRRSATMGRPKNYDRDEILDRAMETFWRHGYAATSTTDLEREMGVNRFSLYAEFHSKHGLYQAALERYLAVVVPGFIGELSAPGAGIEAIETVLRRFGSWAGAEGTEHGCMICNAATEMATDDASIRAVVQRYATTLEGAFVHALTGAVDAGALDEGMDVDGWASQLTTTLFGLMVLIRSRVDPALPRASAAMAIRELRMQTPSSGV